MERHLTWQKSRVHRSNRERRNGHRSLCLWFTGYSGSGKSTLATAIEQKLFSQGIQAYLIDGDNVRHGLNGDLGFSPEDRQENVRRVAHVASLFVDAGVVAITALISPFEQDRLMARGVFAPGDFIEVFVDCPIDTCIERDPKGLYKKALAGTIPEFTGISSPYERPRNPEIIVNTARHSVDDCVEQILTYLQDKLVTHEVTL